MTTTTQGLPGSVLGSLTLIAMIIGIWLAWYALGAVRWEIFTRDPHTRAARLLRLLFAILIGSGVAGFLVQYATATSLLHS
ncbi:MAG: DUF1146 domain-containing protein [Firmicutes bacterium]|nr:DUF1146 domain-containing protein [Bacillota bacterium]